MTICCSYGGGIIVEGVESGFQSPGGRFEESSGFARSGQSTVSDGAAIEEGDWKENRGLRCTGDVDELAGARLPGDLVDRALAEESSQLGMPPPRFPSRAHHRDREGEAREIRRS
jgi:hypothetical protein